MPRAAARRMVRMVSGAAAAPEQCCHGCAYFAHHRAQRSGRSQPGFRAWRSAHQGDGGENSAWRNRRDGPEFSRQTAPSPGASRRRTPAATGRRQSNPAKIEQSVRSLAPGRQAARDIPFTSLQAGGIFSGTAGLGSFKSAPAWRSCPKRITGIGLPAAILRRTRDGAAGPGLSSVDSLLTSQKPGDHSARPRQKRLFLPQISLPLIRQVRNFFSAARWQKLWSRSSPTQQGYA